MKKKEVKPATTRATTSPKVKSCPAWAVMDRERIIEVSLDRHNLPELGPGERLVKVKLVV